MLLPSGGQSLNYRGPSGLAIQLKKKEFGKIKNEKKLGKGSENPVF
jgi:hypothetical protein